MKAIFTSTAVFLAMFGLSPTVWAQQPGGPYGPHMWGYGSWMFFGPMMMIIFIAAIVIVVVLIVRWLGGRGHIGAPYPHFGKTPLDILKERFAKGEIDKEEFEERRRILGE